MMEKLSGITSDGTNCNPAAYYDIKYRWMTCYAHVLHLAVCDALRLTPTLQTEIQKLRAVFKVIRCSKLFGLILLLVFDLAS